MEKKTLGAFIALLRKEKGLTQKQLAELLNVSDKTVSHWECDETSPDISLLPILAQALGVTVDELLQGEKKTVQPSVEHHYIPPKSEGFAARTINKIKSKMSGDITERYRYFRMLSLIGTVIAAVVIISVTVTNLISGYFLAGDMGFIPGIVALLGSLWTLAISLGFTLGARFAFYKSILPSSEADSEERKYVYRANSFCFNNIFLVFCAIPMALTGIDALDISVVLNIPLAALCLAALWLVLLAVLNKKGILCTDKKKLLKIKYLSIFALSALIVSGSLLIFRESYYPNVDDIVFDNSDEFIAYMETPKNKPENAYLVDGFQASTHPPTMPAPGNEPAVDSPIGVGQIPSDFAAENVGETVLGYCDGELVTFKWLNNEVCDCTYLPDDRAFRVITYEAKIRQKDKLIAVDDGVPILIVMFLVVDAVTCLCLYKKKVKALFEE